MYRHFFILQNFRQYLYLVCFLSEADHFLPIDVPNEIGEMRDNQKPRLELTVLGAADV